MKQVIILRHGKSDWQTLVDDFHRPLKRRGKDAAAAVGQWLSQQDFKPDCILSSPAERAYQTALICARPLSSEDQITTDKRLYLADVDDICSVLAEHWDIHQRLMVIGHNPGLEEFVVTFASKPVQIEEDGKLLPTASFAIFQFEHCPSLNAPGSGELLCRYRPSQLNV